MPDPEILGRTLPDTRNSGPNRRYATPKLICYGRLSDLTLGGSFIGNDGNTQCVGNAGKTDQCAS